MFDLIAEQAHLSDRFRSWRRARRYRMLDWDHRSEREVDAACGAFLMLRRTALEAVGEFDERFFLYWEETDWLLRAKRAGWRTVFMPDVSARHDGGESTEAPSQTLELLRLESDLAWAQKRYGAASLAVRATGLAMDGARLALAAASRGDVRTDERRAYLRRRIALYRRPDVLPLDFDRVRAPAASRR